MNQDSQKLINKAIADYNLIASKFSSTRSKLSPDLIELADGVGDSERILDYGCGNGRLCQLFNSQNYLGVDPSTKLIKIAREKFPDYHFELIEPSIVPKGESYTIIYCLAVVHHFPDKETQRQLITDLASIIKPGGKLVLTAWCLDQCDKIIEKPFKSNERTITRQIFSFSQQNLDSLIKSSGLQVLSSKIVPRNRGVYSNIEIVAHKYSLKKTY